MLADDVVVLHGVPHLEAGGLHQAQQGDVGLLHAEDVQRPHQVPGDLAALPLVGVDEQRHIGDGQHPLIAGDLQEDHVGHQGVFADEMVGLVQHGHQKVPGLGVAAHQRVGLPGLDHLDGVLDGVGAAVDGLQLIGPVLQTQALEHLADLFLSPHQDGLHKALLLGGKGAEEDVFHIRAGNGHPHGLLRRLGLGDDALEFLCILDFHGLSLLRKMKSV